MPKVTPQAELDAVIAAVEKSTQGVSVGALALRFPTLPRRSLQRRLAWLIEHGRLAASGKGPARRYHGAVSLVVREPSPDGQASNVGVPRVEDYVRTSSAGAKLHVLVRRPLSRRTPTGFHRQFLDRYQPNSTFYLPRKTRDRLRALGRPGIGQTPAGTYARQILGRLLVDLSWASSRLEGNTYSRLDTQNLLEFGRYAEGKDRLEAQMILNHKAAIEMLVDQADEIDFNRYTLQNLHALLAENLLPDAGAGGRLRTIDVGIGGSVYHPTAIPQLIIECFDSLLEKARAIEDPFEQAFFIMVQLPYL
ncbi:MAG: Fic family protein, partial [Rhodanobacteraceae bacterium]